MYIYICTCVYHSSGASPHALAGWGPVGTARILQGLLSCWFVHVPRALSLSLPSTDNAPYRSPLAISLDLSRCIYIYIHIYTYIYICISSTVNAPHRSPPHISLSLAVYTYNLYMYIYIYIYICMYILQALTAHHTPLQCLSLHTSSAYQNSELA